MLTNGQTCTLSFWYRQSTNGGPLVVRLAGSTLTSTVNPGPTVATNLARSTPGTTNSVRATLVPFPSLWLNEVLPNNLLPGTNSAADRFGEREPWAELYNGGTNTVALDGYFLAKRSPHRPVRLVASTALIAATVAMVFGILLFGAFSQKLITGAPLM